MGGQHIGQEKKLKERQEQQLKQYLQEVAAATSGFNELFICGPADTKDRLQRHLEDVGNASGRTVAVAAADSMTDNQIVALVKKHFAK